LLAFLSQELRENEKKKDKEKGVRRSTREGGDGEKKTTTTTEWPNKINKFDTRHKGL
jgi:hypothetical protein